MQKKTVVLGASDNEKRYSNMAIKKLIAHDHPVIAIGNRKATTANVPIVVELLPHSDVDTITIYLSEINQKKYYNYILSLKPKRIIFNPGTENEDLERLATENGIKTMQACTLVLLASNQY